MVQSAQDRIRPHPTAAIDVAAAGPVGPTLAAWFSSAYWGFPLERSSEVEVRLAPGDPTEPPAASDAHLGRAAALADAIRRSGELPANEPSPDGPPAAPSDRALDAQGVEPFATSELREGRFEVSVAGQVHRTGDLADVLAQLLLLRLNYVFGEDLVVELTRASGRGPRRIASAFATGPLLSPHVLLPTRAGRSERSWLATMPGSALIPAVAYAPVVAHLLAPRTTIRPVDRSVRYWALESARPDAGPNRTAVESPWVGGRLRWRRSLLRLLRSVLLLVLRAARRTPLRPRRHRASRLAALVEGSFRRFPARLLEPGRERANRA